MANKLNNKSLNIILENCKEYKILDIYISLAYSALETKNGQFVIQTYSDSFSDLISVIRTNVRCSYKTAYNCINTLINLNILNYNSNLCCWTLTNMEDMFKSKQDNPTENLYGYTHIRQFFLSEKFYNMTAREKRLVVYLCQLSDSKKSNYYSDFVVNLLKPNSSWLKILKTKSIYYARKTLENLLKKYNNIFIDKSYEIRETGLAPKRISRFKFKFSADELKKNNDDELFETLKNNNTAEYNLILNKIKSAGITLTKQKIMHLLRGISGIRQWFLKERVIQVIINKYIAIQIHKSREDIKSLPAYTAAVVNSICSEFKTFLEQHKKYSKSFAAISYSDLNIENDMYKSNILKLISKFN